MTKRTARLTALVIAVLVLALNFQTPATAGETSSGAAPAADGESTTYTLTITSPGQSIAAGALECNVTVDNPHYSGGAPGMIAKIRYNCFGNISGTLGINANLYRYKPGEYGPYTPKASNNVSRPVGPLAADTVYVPAASLPGIYCNMNHWYYANAWLTLSGGASSSTGYVTSNTVHPQRCS